MMTNRERLLTLLSSDLSDALATNDLEASIEEGSYTTGFYLLAIHIALLIKNMENDGSTSQEIIDVLKEQLDNGPEPVLN